MSDSKLIQKDIYTEQSYAMDGFDPKTNDSKYSYTSGRVMKRVYNKYNATNKPKVFGYYTDWSQYDKRASVDKNGAISAADRGRGIDLTLLDPTAYDKIIIGFMGIVGDQGENQAKIAQAAAWTGKTTNQMTIMDPWGDCQSAFNNGFTAWQPLGFGPGATYNDGTSIDTFYQDQVQGVFGGLRELQKKALQQGHELALSFSIGGWTMSHAFHELAKSESGIKTFANSIVDFIVRFPMFTEIDIDWEYPNGAGNGNPHGPEDGANYVTLMGILRRTLDSNGLSNVKISIASSANVELLKHSNVKALLAAGMHGINVMTYDFFGTPWAERLANHTNLYKTEHSDFSLQEAVEYLLEEGVDAECINVGYAGYSRSAKGAEISSFSPLDGTYNGAGTTVGTFESGCVEWYDVINNYLDLENQGGRNGYRVYTDQVACADYLYNPELKVFHSIDTPRTVREKARYVIEKGLGGLFTWTIEQDNGVLVNAAREGMDCPIVKQVIDMAPFYFEGENVTPAAEQENEAQVESPAEVEIPQQEDKEEETGVTNQAPNAHITIKATSGSRLVLSSLGSSDPEGDPLTFKWVATGNIQIVSPAQAETVMVMPSVSAETLCQITLTVDDGHGNSTQAFYALLVVPAAAETETETKTEDAPVPVEDDNAVATYPAWSATSSYTGGSKVSHKGSDYLAKWWVGAGTEPGLASTTGKASGDAMPWTKI
ncbi:glycosyl hydrolase family 18 protein [Serratia quinivorans]|uniref:glycosyl hydrolase family 18 protein n=1 Tax=Serratia quinivorans TaxID=137545 RepID=UPI001C45DA28|nr:glycosyl hydrolase family 18 protein [Serratia quinivorans]MBV6694019.1 chitinase [Serratia quinivorans]